LVVLAAALASTPFGRGTTMLGWRRTWVPAGQWCSAQRARQRRKPPPQSVVRPDVRETWRPGDRL